MYICGHVYIYTCTYGLLFISVLDSRGQSRQMMVLVARSRIKHNYENVFNNQIVSLIIVTIDSITDFIILFIIQVYSLIIMLVDYLFDLV